MNAAHISILKYILCSNTIRSIKSSNPNHENCKKLRVIAMDFFIISSYDYRATISDLISEGRNYVVNDMNTILPKIFGTFEYTKGLTK